MHRNLDLCIFIGIVLIFGSFNDVKCNDVDEGDEGDGVVVADVEEEPIKVKQTIDESNVKKPPKKVALQKKFDPYRVRQYQHIPNDANSQYQLDPNSYQMWPYYDDQQNQYHNPDLWYQQQQYDNLPYAYLNQWGYPSMPYYPPMYNPPPPPYPVHRYPNQPKNKKPQKSTKMETKPQKFKTPPKKATTPSCQKGDKYLKEEVEVPCTVKTESNNKVSNDS